MSDPSVLSVNSGSSSIKVALFTFDGDEPHARSRLERAVHENDHRDALRAILDELSERDALPPSATGHRIVHGGPSLSDPVVVDDGVLAELRAQVAFAPLHLPAALSGIELVGERFPGVPRVASFDTAFHRTMPERARRFPLPDPLWDEGVRRYGFHGLSYEYVVGALGDALGVRSVIAHLGNGASMVALRDGVSIDTTMGLTPTGGLVMGTRSGDLDPGLIVYLLRERGYDADALEALVDQNAGLRALSGGTSDMKALLERRAADDHRSRLAIDAFCHRARQSIGALAAELGGLDTLVFTGGIGEAASAIRAEICVGLEFLGVQVDPHRNDASEAVISSSEAVCTVRVVRTDEDVVIARHAAELIKH